MKNSPKIESPRVRISPRKVVFAAKEKMWQKMWPCTQAAISWMWQACGRNVALHPSCDFGCDFRKNNNFFFFLYLKIIFKSQLGCRATFLPHVCHIHEIAAWVQGHISCHIFLFNTKTLFLHRIRCKWISILDGFFHQFRTFCIKSAIRNEHAPCIIQYGLLDEPTWTILCILEM